MARRTDWFREAKWGVLTHYLSNFGDNPPADAAEQWNRQIDAFDVDGLVAQLKRVGAPYYYMTVGQVSGFYCSPNETYDNIVGRKPSWLSRRDLISDLADAVNAAGIRMMVYMPNHAPTHDMLALEKFRCVPPWEPNWLTQAGLQRKDYPDVGEVDERLTDLQRYWEAVTREWSLRWGKKIHGWWIDGCFYPKQMYYNLDEPNFESFANAIRAGNPDSIVGFNPGTSIPVRCNSKFEDYTAGEIDAAFPISPTPWDRTFPVDGYVKTAQYHILTHTGPYWGGTSAPRLSKNLLAAYTEHINSQKGVITWDVPIRPNGLIPEDYVELLEVLKDRA